MTSSKNCLGLRFFLISILQIGMSNIGNSIGISRMRVQTCKYVVAQSLVKNSVFYKVYSISDIMLESAIFGPISEVLLSDTLRYHPSLLSDWLPTSDVCAISNLCNSYCKNCFWPSYVKWSVSRHVVCAGLAVWLVCHGCGQ
jgi:hypothetical protein